MQSLNYAETNGIIIGPEFSRIFAELILQSVDKKLLIKLSKSPYEKVHKKDYQIFRYVDDYFIFYNDEDTKKNVIEALQLELKEFKLYLNSNKAVTYDKPIITEITIAKQRIAKLLNEKINYKLDDKENKENVENESDENDLKKIGSIYVTSNHLITQFKTIIKECNVEYKDVLNYALAIIEIKFEKIINEFLKVTKKKTTEKNLIKAFLEILDFVFFIYAVSPRVNTTIKLCRILRVLTEFLKRKDGNSDLKHIVFKSVYDNICFILKKNKNDEHTQVETLYLLVALSELGRDYWLDETSLARYFNIEMNSPSVFSSSTSTKLNYFSITVLLFYMKKKKRFNGLRDYMEKIILEKFKEKSKLLLKDAEFTFLLLDCLSCPYITTETKKSLLTIYKITNKRLQNLIINNKQVWFTQWVDFDFGKALDAKKSQEVY
jgi:hypothetical protein